MNKEIKQSIKEFKENIILARSCMDFIGLECNNKDCKNLSCPLNKEYSSLKRNSMR